MLSLSKLFRNVKITGPSMPTACNQTLSKTRLNNARTLSTTIQSEKRARHTLQHSHESGWRMPRKNANRFGNGGSRNYWYSPKGSGNTNPKRMRTKYLAAHPSETARVEDLPMFWMLEPMTADQRKKLSKTDSIREWQENMVDRGYEPFYRCKTQGITVNNLDFL